MAINAKWSYQITVLKQHLEDCSIFFCIGVYEHYFYCQNDRHLISGMEKNAILVYVTMARKPSHCLEFTLTILFKTNFLLTEKQICTLKMFTIIT